MKVYLNKRYLKQTEIQFNNGFTLIELIVTIAVLAILTSIATPYFTNQLRKHEMSRVVKSVRSVFIEARSEALTRHQFVTACLTDDGTTCSKSASTYFMSFIDKNSNNQYDDMDETMLTKITLGMKYGSLKFRFGMRNHTRFSPNTGKPRGHMGNVTYCPNNGDMTLAKSVILSEHGRARLSFDFNGDGVDDKRSSSEQISCH